MWAMPPRYRPCKVEILCVPLDEGGARVDEYRAGGERSLPVDADVRNWLPESVLRCGSPFLSPSVGTARSI